MRRIVRHNGRRWLRRLAIDARVIVACILVIGLCAALAVDRLHAAGNRARGAEASATRLRIVVERYGQIQLQYQIHPDQPVQIFAQFVANNVEAQRELDEIARLSPGPEQRALAAAYAHLVDVTGQANTLWLTDPGNQARQRAFVQREVVPAGEAFSTALTTAQTLFRRHAERSQEIARWGAFALLLAATATIAALVLLMDGTRHRATRTLARREARFRTLVEHGSDLITVVDPDGVVRFQSGSIVRVLGKPAGETVGAPFARFVAPADAARFAELLGRVRNLRDGETMVGAFALRHADGRDLTFEIAATHHLGTPEIEGIVLTAHDVTAQQELTSRLRHQALHDPLTGLPNRELLLDRLRGALARAARTGNGSAVIVVDLDGFKAVNDQHGHAVGDIVLRLVGSRLQAAVREVDTVARFGGDEFVLLLENVDHTAAGLITQRVRSALAMPYPVGGQALPMAASVGVALHADPLQSGDELIRAADAAMYAEKRAAKLRGPALLPVLAAAD